MARPRPDRSMRYPQNMPRNGWFREMEKRLDEVFELARGLLAFKGFLAPAWSPELVCVRIQGDITPEAEDDFQESMLELDQHLRDRAAEHREDRTCSRQCLRKLRLYFRFLHVIRQAHKKRARWRFIRNKQPPVGQQADSSQLVGANQKQRYALRHPQLRAGQMSNVFGGGAGCLA